MTQSHSTMHHRKPESIRLYEDIRRIVEGIPVDLGGGSPLPKSFLMASIALENNLRIYVEIGVYRGRSFFPMAHAAQQLGGMAYGIDAYDAEIAKEHDLDEQLSRRISTFLDTQDFSKMYEEVESLRNALGLSDHSRIIKAKSTEAVDYIRAEKISIDMLHIDGNHDAKYVVEDVNQYLPLVRDGGYIVMDDVNWGSVRPSFNKLKKEYEVLFNNGLFAILSKRSPTGESGMVELGRAKSIFALAENLEMPNSSNEKLTQADSAALPIISVIVTAYNQEMYIGSCLESILAQKGDFKIEIVIGDDCSSDGTLDVINGYIGSLPKGMVEVKILIADENLGITKNLRRCLDSCTGDYIAICEADDYWIDCHKLQIQLEFLRYHPECALCFNDFYMFSEVTCQFSEFGPQEIASSDTFTTKHLVQENFIGNFSCCLYDAQFVERIPGDLFDMFVVDWMFNMFYSQFGEIGHIRKKMSVYRKHSEGAWAGKEALEVSKRTHAYIDEYNKFLNYEYDREFTLYQKRIEKQFPSEIGTQMLDIAIIDDAFPHPLSAFRMEEFLAYLEEFKEVKIFSSGASIGVLGDGTLDELIAEFKRKNPPYAGQIEKLRPDTIINAKAVYTVFLGNTYLNIDLIEQSQTPFVFTLYPGGFFGIDNERSNMMLRRITSSPCFQKVIVTQNVTYDYLINHGFCSADQIEFIFGIVTPQARIGDEYASKTHFGFDKDFLDICFVAHKYVERGTDKGYDVFVDVAKQLSRRYDNINFHVVGGFNREEIDVSDIENRIAFYGAQGSDWFDDFYRDKDIILSPNLSSRIYPGSFDGFPTGSCVDAGLRKTAIFCTDELELNTKFIDGDEIVIVPHDADNISEAIESYYVDPEKLRRVAENGSRTIERLYDFEEQMHPRLRILREQIGRSEHAKELIIKDLNRRAESGYFKKTSARIEGALQRIALVIINALPISLRRLIGSILRRIRSNPAVYSVINRFLPESLRRIYGHVRMFQ